MRKAETEQVNTDLDNASQRLIHYSTSPLSSRSDYVRLVGILLHYVSTRYKKLTKTRAPDKHHGRNGAK